MNERFVRTRLLLGEAAEEKLAHKRVAVFGIGGVGGFACEAMVRSGIGAFDLIDSDTVSVSNINRQIIALTSTIGLFKTDVMKERMEDINPLVKVRVFKSFVLPENIGEFPFEEYDYVVDAVDTVSAKTAIIERAYSLGIPVISAMGAGNKLDGSLFRVADISDTRYCPLARVMRRELRKRGIERLKVVYSEEKPAAYAAGSEELLLMSEETTDNAHAPHKRSIPGSTAFVPSMAGLLMGGEVVKDLAGSV